MKENEQSLWWAFTASQCQNKRDNTNMIQENCWKAQGTNISYQNLVSSLTRKTEIIPQKWLRFLKIMILFAKRMQAEKL